MGNFTKLRKAVASFTLSSLLVSSLIVPSAFALEDNLEPYMQEAAKALLSKDALVKANKCEVAQLFVNAFSLEITDSAKEEGAKFQDLADAQWCQGPVGALVENGIAQGMKANEWFGLLDPETKAVRNVSRAEVVKMTVDALGLSSDGEMAELTDAQEEELKATDWARDHFAYAIEAGIVTGDAETGALRPTDSIIKGDAAVVLYRATKGGETPSDGGSSSTPSQDPVVEAGALSVALSSSTPAAMSIPKEASSVAFAAFDLTASNAVEVESITLTRSGLGSEDDLDDVFFTDMNGAKVSTSRSLNSSDQVVLSLNGGLDIAAGETVTLYANAEINTSSTNTQHALGIASAEAIVSNASSVSGSFPVVGNTMTVADFTIGNLGFSANGSGNTVDVGDVQKEIAEFKLTDEADTNDTDVLVRSITLEQDGTLDSDNLANLALYQNGRQVTEATSSWNGDYITFVYNDGGYMLEDGDSRVFEIRADITGGSDGETVAFSLDEGSDIIAEAVGVGKFAPRVVGDDTPSSSDAAASNVSLNTYTVNAGDIAFAKDTTSRRSQLVASDTEDFDFLTLRVTVAQDIQVEGMGFQVALNDAGSAYASAAAALTGANASLDDFRIVRHAVGESHTMGSTVASESDATEGTTAYVNVVFSDQFELEAGQHLLTFVADVLSAATAADEYTVTHDISDLASNIEYIENGDTVATADITGGDASGAEMTVGAATLAVSRNDDNVNNDVIVQGMSNKQLMTIVLDNNDVETVTVTDMTFGEDDGAVVDFTTVSNCVLKDAEGNAVSDIEDYSDASTTASDDATLSFSSMEVEVAQNEQIELDLYCDFSTSLLAADTIIFSLDSVTAEDAQGDSATVNEGGSALSSANPLNSANFATSAGGSLSVERDSNRPRADVVAAPNGQYSIAKFKFHATDDDIEVTDFTLNFLDDDMSSRIANVYAYNEAGELLDTAAVVDAGNFAEADFTFAADKRPMVEADEDYRIEIKAQLNDISEVAQSGLVAQAVLSDNLADNVEAISTSTGQDLSSSSITVTNTDAALDTDMNNVSAASNTNNDANPVVYTVANNLLVGDTVIVTDDATYAVNASAALVTNASSTSVTLNKNGSTYTAAADDDIYVGVVSSAADANCNAGGDVTCVLTVPQGHGIEVGDTPTIYNAGDSTNESATVTAVSSTTISITPDDANFAAIEAGDFLLVDDASVNRAYGDEFVMYAATPNLAKVDLQDSVLGFGEEEVFRFSVSANEDDVLLNRLSFDLSQTDTTVQSFSIYEVDGSGNVLEDVTIGSSSTALCTLNGAIAGNVGNNSETTLACDAGSVLTYPVGSVFSVTKEGNNDITETPVKITANTGSAVTLTVASGELENALADDVVLTLTPFLGKLTVDSEARGYTSGLVTINLSENKEVVAGETTVFELRASTADFGAQDNNSLSVSLELDSSKPTDLVGGTTLTRTASNLRDAYSMFIWSDNPDSDTSTATDFHNGYLVDHTSSSSTLRN